MLRNFLIVTWIALAIGATGAGWGYYVTPIQERPFLDAHNLFASSAVVGHGYGVLGSAFMAFGVVMYSVRKRVARFSNIGKLKHWLQVHIFLCTFGPFLILLHSTFRVGGLVSIAFWSMVLVVASGVFGRYLYVRIPKTLQGSFLSLEAVEKRRAEALSAIQNRGSLHGLVFADEALRAGPQRTGGLLNALLLELRWDLNRRKMESEIRQRMARGRSPVALRDEVVALALEQARLGRQIALIGPFQRLFRYWHVFHLPLAIVMFLILGVHVAVAVIFGYAWVL